MHGPDPKNITAKIKNPSIPAITTTGNGSHLDLGNGTSAIRGSVTLIK